MSKFNQLVGLLERRIARGDYLAGEPPTQHQLAQETGVSRMTARKAILHLVERGVIAQKENGRMVCQPAQASQSALLVPSFPSPEYSLWRYELERLFHESGLALRPVDYVQWDDPALVQTLNAFGTVFLIPTGNNMPDSLLRHFRAHPRAVVLGQDYSSQGLLSIYLFPLPHLNGLLDHLLECGCRTIDCLSSQPQNDAIAGRVAQWRMWLRRRELPGELVSGDFAPLSNAMENAHALASLRLASGMPPDAFFCTNITAAVGAVRACADRGLSVGRDIKVCAVNGERMNRFLTPSMTCLEPGELRPYLELIVQWLRKPETPWDGPPLLQPEAPNLFVGESTRASMPS